MFRVAPSIDRRNAGFTVIEVLIALAVVAVVIMAIGSVMSTSVRGVRSLEQHVTLMQAQRLVMEAELPPRAELGFGTWSGKTGDHQWEIDVGPMAAAQDVPDASGAWMPALVRIQVRSPSGAVSDLRTVRLIHGSPQ